jgi:RNA polymerase sigma-70 factor (ECF subfamily)
MSQTAREQLLEELRPASFAIAYRMLGSVAEAEDVVQEALLALDRELAKGEEISSPRAFVSTVTTRLAIDNLRSARVRRERYVGEWLPEPLLTSDSDDPALRAEMADSISTAMLVLLETLSPEQRAAFLLHDVFDYGYADVAGIIGKSEQNTRQLASRARRHLEDRRPRFQTSRERRDELARRFFAAVNDGELDALEALLADDVVLTGDGGGEVPALARPLSGRSRVAGALRNWVRFGTRLPGASVRPLEVNGGPGALLLDGEQRVMAVWSLQIGDRGIERINSVVNPHKLAHLGAVADLRALVHAVLDRR